MKATIDNLFSSYKEVISFDGSNTDYPHNFSDLERCDNVVVGEKLRYGYRVIIIDDNLYRAIQIKTYHPCGGKMYLIEVEAM